IDWANAGAGTQAINPAITDPRHRLVIDIAILFTFSFLCSNAAYRAKQPSPTIRRLCFAKMSPVTHLVLFVSPPQTASTSASGQRPSDQSARYGRYAIASGRHSSDSEGM